MNWLRKIISFFVIGLLTALAQKNSFAQSPDLKFAGLSPDAAAHAMTLPEKFSVKLFAGEPDVKQPVAFCIDDRGRLWVAEAYTYPGRRPAPPTNASESEKQKDIFGGNDRILIFEDTDGDGHFDKKTLFAENLNLVSAIEIGFGGVWVGASPYLLFFPVRDGEDKPAGPPQILLDGFGYQDTHDVFSSFIWGPDGWLYGGSGITCYSKVGKPGASDSEREILNGAIWRFHPITKKFERFAEGVNNPWGIDFDEHGQCFATGCVIPHLWHIVQGARYQRLMGNHISPHIYEDIQTIADHRHWAGADSHAGRDGYREKDGELKTFADDYNAGGGHAHAGGMIYLGDNWPEKYRGKIFMNNLHGHRINMDILEPRGSGFVGHHGEDFLFTHDKWSLSLDLDYGPDGSVYMIDYYEKNICHNPNPALFDRSNGRIYKITYGEPKFQKVDLQKKSDEDLIKFSIDNRDWSSRHARRILQERALANGDLKNRIFLRMPAEPAGYDPDKKLRWLWTLHATGGQIYPNYGLSRMNEFVRAWTIQLLCEDKKVSPEILKEFARLAHEDKSPIVRLYLASALQRIDANQRREILEALVAHTEDASDQNLPLMYWYAAEPLVASDTPFATKLLNETKIPQLRKFIARRLASQAVLAEK